MRGSRDSASTGIHLALALGLALAQVLAPLRPWADPPETPAAEGQESPGPVQGQVAVPLLDEAGYLVWRTRRDPALAARLESAPDDRARDVLLLTAAADEALRGPDAYEQLEGLRPALPGGASVDEVRVEGAKGGFFVSLPAAYLDGMTPERAQFLSEVFLGLSRNSPRILDHRLMIRDPSDGKHYPLGHFLPVPEPVPLKEGEEEGDIRAEATGQPPAGGQGQPAGYLTGKSVFVNPGHGWYYSSTLGRWATQRGNTNNIIEDHSNAEAVMTYLTHYLWNAGAGVYTCRERDMNPDMAVVDNGGAGYAETGTWTTVTHSSAYGGNYRQATTSPTETATATFTPNVPADGYYRVYLWYRGTSANANDAKVTVRHTGGATVITLNQERDGATFKDLGLYYFRAGSNAASGSVRLSNQSAEGGSVVAADAVRLGGGTGAQTPFGEPSASGWPRFEEAGPYYANFMGCPSATCGSSTVSAISRYCAWENESWEDPVFVSWHSNAGSGTSRGTSSFAYTTGDWDDPFSGVPGGLELRDAVHAEILNDLWAGYDPSWQDRGLHTANFGEINPSYNPEMPGALFEMAFHDNATDSLQLQNPIFRQIVARAVYQGIVKYLAARDEDPNYTLLPEPPTNLRVRNDGTGKLALSWNAPPYNTGNGLLGDAATGYRVYRSLDGLGYDNGVTVTGTSYTDASVTPGTAYYYRVTATNAGGESFPTETLAARAAHGAAPVLIVSGFDRLGQSQIVVTDDPYSTSALHRGYVDMMNSYRYCIRFAESVDAFGAGFDSCSNEAVISGQVPLSGYQAVLWYSGEESEADQTFDATERSLLQAYLNGGGRLFASGSEIGWDLDYSGNGPSFYNGYLKADYAGDDAGTYNVAIPAGGIFAGDAPFSFDDNSSGEYDCNYPDQLTPLGGATVCLTYGGGAGNAGVQYDGATFKVVTFGFPFETITSSASRDEVMADILAFFGVQPDTGDSTSPAAVGDTLMWNRGAGRWEWAAVTLDRLGNPEPSVHYEVRRSTSAAVPGALLASPTENRYPDPSLPSSGCWFYTVKAVDSAGNAENPELDAIRDNPSASFAGTWSTGTSAPGHYGADYRYIATGGTGANTATWSFSCAERGWYQVRLYYPEGANRSNQSRFTVHHAGGGTLYTVNQRAGGGTWNLLGDHWLEPGTWTVVLDDAEPSGSVVIADAVRWTK